MLTGKVRYYNVGRVCYKPALVLKGKMAHSSFIDCEVGNGLPENFIAEADLKVELEAQQVNDDENVAVEVLGRLSGSYDSGTDEIPSLIPIIKTEENCFTFVHEVQVDQCVSDDGSARHITPDIVCGDHNDVKQSGMIIDHDNANNIVHYDNNIIDHNNDSDLFNNEDNDYLTNCTMCGLRFKNNFELQNHVMTTHSNNANNRPYKCDSCLMSFQRKSSLKNHSKIHTYGGSSSYKTVDNKDSTNVNKNEKQKTDNRKRNKKGVISVKKFDDMQDNRIPPFETLKPNTVTGNTNFSLENNVNNLFEDWSLNDLKSENDVHISANDNSLQPIVDQQTVVVSNLPVLSTSNEFEPKQNSTNFESKDNVSALNQQNLESKEKPYVCPFCNRTFAREKALLNHIRIHNDNYDMTLECQKCHDVFDDIISLQAHLVACVLPESAVVDHHPTPEPVEFYPFEHKRHNYNNNNVNINENSSVGDHVCDICNKRFKTRQKVFRHMWVHRKKMFNCEVCGLSFPGVRYLDEHRLALHPSKAPFACDTCGKSFMSKQGLTEHSRLHKGWSDQYYCNYCEKFFSSRQGFTIHGRIHTGERPYGCKYCPKSFRDGGTLKKHERIHTGERPHECPLCHKRYNQKVVLREHIRGVHVMKKNSEIHGKCPVCGLTNMDKEELSEHIVRHSDELMKKIKQEYLMKQKSLEKNDKTIINRKRRNRVLKKINTNERVNDKNSDHDFKSDLEYVDDIKQDSNYVYPSYKVPLRQMKRRPSTRRRVFDKKTVINKSNQKKKSDNRYEPKKAKKVLKGPPSKKNSNQGSGRVNEIECVTNTQEALPQLEEPGSENSNSHFENDYNKTCLADFAEEFQQMKLMECEMCHARFPTRSELITHILVHI